MTIGKYFIGPFGFFAFLLITIVLCVFAAYFPYIFLDMIAERAMTFIESFQQSIRSPVDFKIYVSLAVAIMIIFSLLITWYSVLVRKLLQMRFLGRICQIAGLYCCTALLIILALLWLDFRYYKYNSGYEVVIGWIFHFHAIQ